MCKCSVELWREPERNFLVQLLSISLSAPRSCHLTDRATPLKLRSKIRQLTTIQFNIALPLPSESLR